MGSKLRKKMRKAGVSQSIGLATNFDRHKPGSGCDCCNWNASHDPHQAFHNHGPSAVDILDKAKDARDPRLAIELASRAKELARKEIGAARFFDGVGSFWFLPYTRPYMEATSFIAQILRMLGKNVEAIEHFRELLRLNPTDNQGTRWHFMLALLDAAKDEPKYYDELDALLVRYPERMVTPIYTKALMLHERQGEYAATFEAFKYAVLQNPHVFALLPLRLPEHLVPDHFVVGSRDEALGYVFEAQDQWVARPEAMKYLAKIQAEFASQSKNLDRR